MKELWGPIDWRMLFSLDMSLGEIFIRGTLVYLFLLFLFRLLPKQCSGISISDLLLVVVLGNAVQNAIVAQTKSITAGLLLGAVVIFWNFFLDFLAYHWSPVRHFIHPDPKLLIKDGQYLISHMERELITRAELETRLRENGVESLAQVKEAYLEGDGKISVIKKRH